MKTKHQTDVFENIILRTIYYKEDEKRNREKSDNIR